MHLFFQLQSADEQGAFLRNLPTNRTPNETQFL